MRDGVGKPRGVRFQGKITYYSVQVYELKVPCCLVEANIDKVAIVVRFNATDMLERLRGKRVIIVGDSLNRNQWESLACLLYSAIPPSQAHVDVKSGIYKVFRAKVGLISFISQCLYNLSH